VAHLENAPPRLAHGGEDLGEDVVEGLPLREALAELTGAGRELLVGESMVLMIMFARESPGGARRTLSPLRLPGDAEVFSLP
jgi:hypothetical protein